MKTVSQYLSKYIGHPNNKVNGIEMNSGSLGHGLSVAIGMALAGKMDKRDYRVYVVMGDGELAEGSVWKAPWPAVTISWTISAPSLTETVSRSPARPNML